MEITNIHVDNVSWDMTRAALGWECGEYRFHVWIDISNRPAAFVDEGTVYKNPKVGREGGRTIQMDSASGPNRKVLAKVREVVERDDLIRAAIAAKLQEQEAEEAQRLEARAVNRQMQSGPGSYAALLEVRAYFDNPRNEGFPRARSALLEIVEEAIRRAEEPS